MTLLIAVIAAVVATICWYTNPKREAFKLSFLALMYWGASIMWSCDAIFEYKELGAAYFSPEVADMINDGFLGISVVTFGIVIWLVYLFIKDPEGIVKKALKG